MAFIVGLYNREELDRLRKAGFEVMAEGVESVAKFFNDLEKDGQDGDDLVHAVVATDQDCEDYFNG